MFHLIELYKDWCEVQGLPLGYAAEDLATMTDVTNEQREWLETYAKLWELSDF